MRITIQDMTTFLFPRKLLRSRFEPASDHDRHAIIFFGTPHEGGQKALVKIGATAVRIANCLGFRSSSAIVEALKNGSIFSDMLKEAWRHQLESYQIVSFWEGIGEVSRVFCRNQSN